MLTITIVNGEKPTTQHNNNKNKFNYKIKPKEVVVEAGGQS